MIFNLMLFFSLSQAQLKYEQLYTDCMVVKPEIKKLCNEDVTSCRVSTAEDLKMALSTLKTMAKVDARIETELTPRTTADMSLSDLMEIINLNATFCAYDYPKSLWSAVVAQGQWGGEREAAEAFIQFIQAPPATLKKTKMKMQLLSEAVSSGFLKANKKEEMLAEIKYLEETILKLEKLNYEIYRAEVQEASTWRKIQVRVMGFSSYFKGRYNTYPFWDKEFARKEVKDLELCKKAATMMAALINKYKN